MHARKGMQGGPDGYRDLPSRRSDMTWGDLLSTGPNEFRGGKLSSTRL